jgi:hypothetical protein
MSQHIAKRLAIALTNLLSEVEKLGEGGTLETYDAKLVLAEFRDEFGRHAFDGSLEYPAGFVCGRCGSTPFHRDETCDTCTDDDGRDILTPKPLRHLLKL